VVYFNYLISIVHERGVMESWRLLANVVEVEICDTFREGVSRTEE
jgi:hypothetical protein